MDQLYMRLEGIDGEEPIGDSEDLVKIASYNHSLGIPTAAYRPSVGKDATLRRAFCEHGLFTVTKAFDKTSPKLFEACASAVVFPTVVIYLCILKTNKLKKQREMQPMISIVMKEAVMAAFTYGFEEVWPVEEIAFRYQSIGWKTDWVDPVDGADATLEPVGWEGTTNLPTEISIPGDLKWGSGSLL